MEAPRLETQHLLLRPYEEGDRQQFIALNLDPEARRHMNGPLTLQGAHQRFEQFLVHSSQDPDARWAIIKKAGAAYAGHVYLQREPQYRFHQLGTLLFPAYWGRGYGTEATRKIVEFGLYTAGLPGLRATVDCDHPGSIRMLEKSGFSLQSTDYDEQGPYFTYTIQT